MDDTQPHTNIRQARWRSILLACVVVMAVILVGWMLRATSVFVVPIVFSVFLALLVAPVDRWGTEHAPDKFRWLGHVASMGTILLTLLVFIGCIWLAAQQVVERFPLSSDEAGGLLPSFGAEVSTATGPAPSAPDQSTPGDASAAPSAGATAAEGSNGILSRLVDLFGSSGTSLANRLADWAAGHATAILGAAGTTLGAAVLVFFLTLMMLIESPRWQKKVATLSSEPSRQDTRESVGVIADRLRRYLWARTILGVLTAFLYVAWLWIFGVDLLIVWGLLAFLLNFIPTFGSLVAGILPVIYAFVQKDFGTAVAVGAGILVIEQIMGNYVDPRVQGRQVSLSPLVVLIALLFWTWLWGIAGAFLAVPVTIAIATIAAHVGPLRPLGLLLSNETDAEGLDRMASRRNR
ncbi:Predicted PurR-regulated permease PerM [Palleronia marisminoris]|uniref:AI-2E family transporter n=1 Tax=Palleronia marisminoris TaxID=315423 RepID=UPI0008F065D5|nr:AI-2E family transporter [Palleronia marisminoris]SFH26551.1 Predicted PurR-regulated permease PerM [Palleronia marisminoris]